MKISEARLGVLYKHSRAELSPDFRDHFGSFTLSNSRNVYAQQATISVRLLSQTLAMFMPNKQRFLSIPWSLVLFEEVCVNVKVIYG